MQMNAVAADLNGCVSMSCGAFFTLVLDGILAMGRRLGIMDLIL